MKILIVEDEKSLADALRQILTKAGHIVDTVNDGQSGSEYALSFSYDLIIFDAMLPKLDGFKAVRLLRKQGVHTPILMLTAKSSVSDKVEGLRMGADDYMTKPFDTEELLARINALTRRKGEIALDELSHEDIVLDLRSAMLYCNGDSVQLSKKEFEVARIFFSNPKMTVTKEALIVNVWGIESDATDNNVEAYISFLRKKLKYLKSRITIKNIQKIGYRLEIKEC